MRRSVILWLVAVLAVTALACGGLSLGGRGSTSGVDIQIVNRSPDEVCYVLISPSDSDTWGEDRLADQDTIAPGGNTTISMPEGSYDVRVETCDEAVMATAWGVSSDFALTVGDSAARVRLVVDNQSGEEVCYVYVSPSSGTEWGDDRMGEMETIAPGDKRLFYVRADDYDLQVADCSGEPLIEEYDVDLRTDLTWTLNN
jgi:hypothetical protein